MRLAAMGFLTLGRRMLGVTPDIIEDRIDMVGRGLLGLTVGCARCHDHKFDPIPTADYYSLYGVFQNCVERQVALPDACRRQSDAERKANLTRSSGNVEKKLAETLALRRTGSERGGAVATARILGRPNGSWKTIPIWASSPRAENDELLPGFVRRWEAYLKEAARTQRSGVRGVDRVRAVAGR